MRTALRANLRDDARPSWSRFAKLGCSEVPAASAVADVHVQAAADQIGGRVGHHAHPVRLPLFVGGGLVGIDAVGVEVGERGRHEHRQGMESDQRLHHSGLAAHPLDMRDRRHHVAHEVHQPPRPRPPLRGEDNPERPIRAGLERGVDVDEQRALDLDGRGVGIDPHPELLPLLVGQHLLHAGGVVGVAGMVDGRRDHPHIGARDRLQIDGLQAEASEVSQPLSGTGEVVRQLAGRGSEPV